MTWWPGWNTIEGAEWWHDLFWWVGILCLAGLVASEIVAKRYGTRKDELVAAQQQQKDEAAEKKIADLRARQTQRRLSAEQKAEFVSALSPFPNQKISLMTLGNVSEARDFTSDFIYVFFTAKWDIIGGVWHTIPAGENPVGVEIVVNEKDWAGGPSPSAGALVRELKRFGILDEFKVTVTPRDTPPGVILLRVGAKPTSVK